MAAFGLNKTTEEPEIRAVSSLVAQGYSLGWLGDVGEEIEFRFWNGEEEKEYFVHERFTMKASLTENNQGSYQVGGAVVLELAEIPPCGCQIGCEKYQFVGPYGAFWQDISDGQCVEIEGACELDTSHLSRRTAGHP